MVARVTSHKGIGPGTHPQRATARNGTAVIRYVAGPPHLPRATARNGTAVLRFLAGPPPRPQGDRKGPHPTLHLSRPYKDTFQPMTPLVIFVRAGEERMSGWDPCGRPGGGVGQC